MVTHDMHRTVRGMLDLGIGPWAVYTYGPETCTDLTYHGQPASFSFRVAFASSRDMTWEIIQPLQGPSIYFDFLADHGEGVQHLLFDCNEMSWEKKKATLDGGGFACIQSGRWLGRLSFAYYRTRGTTIEIIDVPPGWQRPEPEEILGNVAGA